MEIGSVLGEAWDLYKRFFARFLLTAIIVFAVLDLLGAAAQEATDDVAAGVLFGLVAAVVGVVGYFWVQATLVETVRDVRDGRADRSIGETFSVVAPRLPSAIVAGVCGAIAIGVGLVLLVVPGLFLLTIWSMIIPVIVIERRAAFDSFGRSREIVRGHGWQVFGLILVIALIEIVSGIVFSLIFSPLPGFLEAWLSSLVADSLTVPFVAAALTIAYFRLTADRVPVEPVPGPEPGAEPAV